MPGYDRNGLQPDFNRQWEHLTYTIASEIDKGLTYRFGEIDTAHMAEHRLDDILAIVRNELDRSVGVSENDSI